MRGIILPKIDKNVSKILNKGIMSIYKIAKDIL